MRVITGSARGRKLKTVEGTETRPTGDRVKEAVFSIIQFDIEGRRALDLFAGTGQMGIEALSRGAKEAVFVDNAPASIKVIRENLEHTGFSGSAAVRQADCFEALRSFQSEAFDIIFLDPPYGFGMLEKTLKKIIQFDTLRNFGIIICESKREETLPDLPAPYFKRREYIYGSVKITVYGKKI